MHLPIAASHAPFWEPVVIQMKDGTKYSGEAQWRKKVPVTMIAIKSKLHQPGKDRFFKQGCLLHTIEWLRSGERFYKTFQVEAGEEKVWCLGERYGNTNCYKVLFEERECLCNNSRRIVQAWIIEDPANASGKIVVLRKKRFADRFEDPELARSVLGIDAMDELCAFSDLPATLSHDNP